jgi:oligoribonuclease
MGNGHSYWIKGSFFDAWADENGIRITDEKPEFVWVDLETTGLNTSSEVTLEVGIVLTDAVGNVCRDGVIDWKVWAPEEGSRDKSWAQAFHNMDPFVEDMHTKSGLIKDMSQALAGPWVEDMHPALVSPQARAWLDKMVSRDLNGSMRSLQLSGSTPHFDRGFLQADLPVLESWFHYRSGVDVSGIREVAKRVNPLVIEDQPTKSEKHRPIPDLVDSLRLYRHLLKSFLRVDGITKQVLG